MTAKFVELRTALFPGVVTEILPVVAPAGTVAVIEVDETTVKPAAEPLKSTLVAPVKLVPVIVTTVVPAGPLGGEKPEMVGGGGGMTVKFVELRTGLFPGVVTEIGPVVAPTGTVAVIEVAETTLNVTAVVPLNFTGVAPVKLVPVIVTTVPTGPVVGVKDVRVGAPTGGWRADVAALVAMPTRRGATNEGGDPLL